MGMTQNFKQRGPQIVVILKSWKSQFDGYIPSTMSAQAAAYPSLFLVSSIAASGLFSSLLGQWRNSLGMGRMACQSQWGIMGNLFFQGGSRISSHKRWQVLTGLIMSLGFFIWWYSIPILYIVEFNCHVGLAIPLLVFNKFTCDPPFSALPLHLVAAPSCGCRDPCFSPPVSRRCGF